VNISLAFSLGAQLPAPLPATGALLVGFLGYGLSLVCFVLALRQLGTARTGAYFSLAPFIGATLSLILYREQLTWPFLSAAALMALGLWLHLTERHEHWHEHELLEHSHAHVHDEHHRHEHSPENPPEEPHIHVHRHERLRHAHPHYPDIHHRHPHR
jgi:hypothetical protein